MTTTITTTKQTDDADELEEDGSDQAWCNYQYVCGLWPTVYGLWSTVCCLWPMVCSLWPMALGRWMCTSACECECASVRMRMLLEKGGRQWRSQ